MVLTIADEKIIYQLMQQVPDGNFTVEESPASIAVMLTALIMELMPIAIEHMPNSVGRCSFRLFGKTCPSAEPITPPANVTETVDNYLIGIRFLSLLPVFHFTVEKVWQR